ncbi:AAA family ATPase [Aphanizomenon flos-aquae NRERC-008]|uniref:AAA family ATPase n=1 Tax=Aphanizomenon flos-aquae FACHB-1249 TaxID=2692889 RepID=A0ABR8ISZ8_APHFL|nr:MULTISPECIES: AAA family ATPase [Aphanizomenon]MBD2391009.1 AAA family ATPase [Aphanizomenon flos-aquae FACHB-1171]MBD2557283.1 AAA family ATPase [Aphanizomenon flos-aquae FACHB-1290]MBD2631871.1 AAA family ATPase [Aphanizomenon sp. FACHB-1399]MBD2642735.1 AAA family ATPase [Aphanizomenon sp. FACHB-1401]MBD2657661.1 AAA family ATPase [Aphanizomenon flos-aquae FACHB-1265]
MRIKQISVSGLFGIFDHIIPLNMDDRITVIHGHNGFGKTAMLRILNAFFNSRYPELRTIPFSKFCVEFDNGSNVEIIKNYDDSDKVNSNIVFNFYYLNLDDIDDDLKSFSYSLPLKGISQEEPNWLEKLKKNIHIRLIQSQRLLKLPLVYSKSDKKRFPTLSTVSEYSYELATLMQDKFKEYGTISQSLDRSFPIRVVKQQLSSDITDEQLRNQLNELEETRSRLIEVGLLEQDEDSEFQIQLQDIDESTKNTLSVYVEDVEKKLNVFTEIATKINLLKRIINNKFSYKEINFSKEKGFIFTTLYNSSLSDSKTLSATDLSSGEQHELVLLYELLFKVEPNSLVLIDEPELSLHVGWQVQFLKDLQEITKLADLDILIATHSPDIIQDRWDLTVELKGPVK